MPVKYFQAEREGGKHFRTRFGHVLDLFSRFFQNAFVPNSIYIGGSFILQTCHHNLEVPDVLLPDIRDHLTNCR